MAVAKHVPPARRSLVRWLWLLCASIFLHWIMIQWGADTLYFPAHDEKEPPVIQTILVTPAPVKPAAPAKPKPKSVTPKTRSPRTQAPTAAPADPVPDTAARLSKSTARTITSADIAAARASVASLMPAPVEAPARQQPQVSGDSPYKVLLPPSAEFEYAVTKTSANDEPLYGHGTIKWQTDGQRYAIDGEAGVLFFTVLTFNSSGHVDDAGIVPDIYREKRFRKAETSTLFRADQNSIDFSYNGKSVPRIGIEQDRISVIWQLAGIGRGSSDSFSAGSEIDLLVAGTRDVDMWRMQIVGQEKIMINDQPISAWHITRIPRPDAHDQKLDIWLAPAENWSPVRLRYTEDNGDYLDLTLSKLKMPA